MGLAGVVPYLATSLSTVVLSFDIQYAATHGQGLLFSGNVSEQLLHIIEPLQLGYGASVRNPSPTLLFTPSNITSVDHLLPRRHPLGSRMGQVRRRTRLPPIRHRCPRYCSRLANSSPQR